jgi:hypothetical protein
VEPSPRRLAAAHQGSGLDAGSIEGRTTDLRYVGESPDCPRGLTLVWYGFSSLSLGLIAASVIPLGLPTAWRAAMGSELAEGAMATVEQIVFVGTWILAVTFTATGVFELFAGLFHGDDEA